MSDDSDYTVLIRGQEVADDGWQTSVETTYDSPAHRFPCPDCGGEVAKAEWGRVPNNMRCDSCGSEFIVSKTEDAGDVLVAGEPDALSDFRRNDHMQPQFRYHIRRSRFF